MKNIISIIQLAISAILIILVLVQERGTGMSESFGGSGGGFTQQRRGLDKIIFYATIVGLVIFGGTSLAYLLL